MKSNSFLIATTLSFLMMSFSGFSQNSIPEFEWAKQVEGIGQDLGSGIAVDGNGYSYVTGWFEDTATFGSVMLIAENYDIFIAKLDASGNFLWVTQAGGSNIDVGKSIAVDGSGNSYVTGWFQGTATFGSTTLTSVGEGDIFIAKLDANGNYLWIKQAGGSGTEGGYSISVDGSGNSYVTGTFSGTATFGSTTLASVGLHDIFITKLDANGNFLWATQAGGGKDDLGAGIAVDGSGNSYIAGHFYNTATFGSTIINSAGDYDIFIAKLDANGTFLWVTQAGGNSVDFGKSIAVDGNGNSYITGYFYNTASFGSTALKSAGSDDVFIAKLDANGNILWARQAGGSNDDGGYGIAVDSRSNSYVTGYFQGDISFDGTILTSAGSYDVFVTKLDASGNFIWVTQAGGINQDYGSGIAVDGSGNSYVTGEFSGTASFGSTAQINAENADVFITKISDEGFSSVGKNNKISALTICPNPTNGKITISTEETIKQIEITNILGEKIIQTSVNNQQTEIDLNNQPSGIYFINVLTDKGSFDKKIIVNK